MWILRPLAIASSVSIRGMVPFMISLIVDFGTPVKIDTWRTDRFLEFMTLSNNITMFLFYPLRRLITLVIYGVVFSRGKRGNEMYCPKCGHDLRCSERDPRYMVCDNCRKKFFMPIEDFYEEDKLYHEPVPIQEKRNACTIISLVLTIAYLAYCIYYWRYSASTLNSSFAESLGYNIAHALVMPHIIAVVVAFLFNWIGVILSNRWFILVCAILYCVAAILMPIYFVFVILQIILSFVGFGLMVSSRNKQRSSFA